MYQSTDGIPELLLALSDAEKDLGVEQCEDDERDDPGGQQPRPHPVVRYVVLVPPELGHPHLQRETRSCTMNKQWKKDNFDRFLVVVQGGWGGWPTGNGKKLSSCQAQLGQATCLAVA